MITTETIPALAESVKPSARLHLNSPYTYYGEPHASPIALGVRTEMAAADIEEKYYYINHTHLPITISRRDGLPMTVAPIRSHTSSDFIIRRVLVLKNLSLSSVLASLNGMSELDCSELEELRRCFKNFDSGSYREASVMLDYTVTLKDLQAKGGSVYHYQLDLAISSKEAALAPAHPYSNRFLNIGGFGEVRKYGDQQELNLKIRYVDHSPVASKKYINIAGKVFALKAQRDAPYGRISGKVNGKRTEMIFPDYLEVFYSANADPNVVNNTGVGHLRVAVAEAKETIGLYDTYEEACNLGNVETARKERLARLLHDVELVKAQVAREKADLEAKEMVHRTELAHAKRELELQQSRLAAAQFELDKQRREFEAERKAQDESLEKEKREHTEKLAAQREERESRFRNEQMQWKDYYEMRAMERRDASDLMKLIPGILLASLSVGAAWMKLSSNAKAA